VIEDSDIEFMDLEEEEQDDEAFSAGRLLGVALTGALISLGLYYVYQQLEPEKKARLKKQATGMIQEQIHSLTEVSDD
jgi:hypothetical protein